MTARDKFAFAIRLAQDEAKASGFMRYVTFASPSWDGAGLPVFDVVERRPERPELLAEAFPGGRTVVHPAGGRFARKEG
jgi:hypothetical protein